MNALIKTALLAWFMLASACEPGTGGQPITFSLALATAPSIPGAAHGVFTTSTGWDVILEEACIAVGPIYFFAGASHLQQASATANTRRPASWANRFFHLVVQPAHAHPGDSHFSGGEVRGEWLGQVALDALAPIPLPLGLQNGLAGSVRSFSLRLDPPRGPLAADLCLRGHHAWVSGVASKAGVNIPFEGGLAIENIGTNRRVDGLPLVGEFSTGTGVRIAVRPSVWLDQADFDALTVDALAVKAPSGRYVITPESQVHRAWFIGARANGSFVGEVTPPPAP